MACTDTTDDSPISTWTNYALYYNVASGTNYIKNNIFYGYQNGFSGGSWVDTCYVYLFYSAAGTYVSDYNDFARQLVDNGDVRTGYAGGAQQLLSAWQSVTGKDANCIKLDPLFVA